MNAAYPHLGRSFVRVAHDTLVYFAMVGISEMRTLPRLGFGFRIARIDNAVKYSRENGNIRINTRSKGDRVFVSIYNDGELLSKEQLIKIWDRFYKADVSRTNKVSTGLGLPIVRLILTEHGEDIWVENYKDTGVMFTFTLIKK